MSVERPIPFVVGLDGLHRAGKGTQAALLQTIIAANGGKSVILRGDGTRDGLGLSEGDPYSEEWQARSRHVKLPEGNTIEGWNAASYLLLKELHDRRNAAPPYDALIVDRTILSRAAFLLHRGVALEGQRLTVDALYPDNVSAGTTHLDVMGTVPDIIFELQVDSPVALLERLDCEDPKFTFRSRNIRGGFTPATLAKTHLPVELEDRVVSIDATREIEKVNQDICGILSHTALAQFVRRP